MHTVDPDFAQVLPLFAWSSGLVVHGICEKHYVDNDTRVVNFTLQNAQLRSWQSHSVSGEVRSGRLFYEEPEPLFARIREVERALRTARR